MGSRRDVPNGAKSGHFYERKGCLLNSAIRDRWIPTGLLPDSGPPAGLVSTEDLVEEIVGELQDEYDDEEELFYWVQPGDILIANARIDIDDLNEMLETDLPNEGFETLGGFIYDHLGRIPSEGESFQIGNLEIKLLKVEGQRIAQVQIKRLPLLDENDEKEE